MYGYPFETGHTVVGTEQNVTGTPRADLNEDTIPVLAWSRLQEAVASLSGRPAPPVLLPEAITENDLLGITVLAFISILAFRHALLTTANTRRERVLRWSQPGDSHGWTLVKAPADHKDLKDYPAPIQPHSMTEAWYTFVAAAVAIAGAIFTFNSSNLRYSKFLIVRQGGLVTYGPSETAKWALDQQNMHAGAVFIAGHWYVAEVVRVGRVAAFEVILTIYCLSALALLLYFYRFGTFREHQLDKGRFRPAVQLIRAVPQAVVGGMRRFLVEHCRVPGRFLHSYLDSYRSTYEEIAQEFAQVYKFDDDFTPIVAFSNKWDGELTPRPRTVELDGAGYEEKDQIEKAAAFLAGDRYGRLRYPQVIALFSSATLIKAADEYHKYHVKPTRDEIRSFSKLFYIKGILFPETLERKEQNGAEEVEVDYFIAACASDEDLRKNHEKLALCLGKQSVSHTSPDGCEEPAGEQSVGEQSVGEQPAGEQPAGQQSAGEQLFAVLR